MGLFDKMKEKVEKGLEKAEENVKKGLEKAEQNVKNASDKFSEKVEKGLEGAQKKYDQWEKENEEKKKLEKKERKKKEKQEQIAAEKQAREAEKQAELDKIKAEKDYPVQVKSRLEMYSEHIEEDDEVVALVWGSEKKKEDGEKTSFWEGVFNEGTLIATKEKVVYGSRHVTSGRVEAEEFIYASIKGIQKKKTGGGHIEIKLISVDDQVYGISTGSLTKQGLEDTNKLIKHINSQINKGSSPVQVVQANDDIPTQLKKLAELKEMGILSEDEFQAKKTELLAKM